MDASPSPSPELQLLQSITGQWVAAGIYAVAKLGVADALADGPRTAEDVAQAVGANADALFRVMRALASVGLFEPVAERRFRLTPMGELLRTDHPRSLRSMSLFQGAPPHWQAWGNFLYSVKTGQPAFAKVHGKPFFEYCQTDPEFAAAFNGAMTGMSASVVDAVLAAYDFSDIPTLTDIGGGHGYLLSAVLARNPSMRGILFDLPHVVSGAAPVLQRAGVADRCQVVEGSFFESAPRAQGYMAKHIIHDWSDEQCISILSHIREAMPADGRVLLIESVLRSGERSLASLIDLEMLNSTDGGRERTEEEFSALFSRAGLRLNRIVPTQSMFCVIEALPA